MKFNLLVASLCLCFGAAIAQCPTGEVQIQIQIQTDNYGYESYWQLVPSGNVCGTGTIAFGGNNAVGCNGGGAQNVLGGGYGNNQTILAGPWCVTENDTFDIIFVDDYADGGSIFTVMINGFPMYAGLTGSGDAPGTRLTFIANAPPANDAACRRIKTNSYVNYGLVPIKAWVSNLGTNTLNSLDFYFSINGGTPVMTNVAGLNIAPFDSAIVTHSIPWGIWMDGNYDIDAWVDNPNGNLDENPGNNNASRNIVVGPPTPNFIDDYIGTVPVFTQIGGSADSIRKPSDLDFHPVLSRYELWVINRSTENIGGTTVKFTNAGKPNQTFLYQKDGNAWHFMSLPTAIAFSENENFATSPGVYDANHSGAVPFTGPTLWSSDPAIYAQPSGGNGSHLDMLHQSPYSMGICSQEENIFWVFDNYGKTIDYYDFKNDHGPGNSDHSDGIIRQYTGLGIAGDPNNEIPSHLVFEKESNMLYIVDTDHGRVLKMDVTTGSQSATLTPYEPTAEYTNYAGASWTVFIDSGLTTPCGIDLIGDRVIVSDYATGDIVIYDNSGLIGTEIGRIVTGTPGVMGVKIGPEGKIYYVNYLTNQVVRIDGLNVGIEEKPATTFSLFPNPANDKININLNGGAGKNLSFSVIDVRGAIVLEEVITHSESQLTFDVSQLAPGIYTIRMSNEAGVSVKKFVKN